MDRQKILNEVIEMVKRMDDYTLKSVHSIMSKREAEMKELGKQMNAVIEQVSENFNREDR